MTLLGTVYLLHFARPLPGGGRHYLGWTTDLEERLFRHEHGDGAVILAWCRHHGISFELVQVWNFVPRSFETRLKRRHQQARLCAICRPTALAAHAARERRRRRSQTSPTTARG